METTYQNATGICKANYKIDTQIMQDLFRQLLIVPKGNSLLLSYQNHTVALWNSDCRWSLLHPEITILITICSLSTKGSLTAGSIQKWKSEKGNLSSNSVILSNVRTLFFLELLGFHSIRSIHSSLVSPRKSYDIQYPVNKTVFLPNDSVIWGQ